MAEPPLAVHLSAVIFRKHFLCINLNFIWFHHVVFFFYAHEIRTNSDIPHKKHNFES